MVKWWSRNHEAANVEEQNWEVEEINWDLASLLWVSVCDLTVLEDLGLPNLNFQPLKCFSIKRIENIPILLTSGTSNSENQSV